MPGHSWVQGSLSAAMGKAIAPTMCDEDIALGESYRRAADLLSSAERVCVLTGAGISTESGIPDFRSPGGLWTRYDPRKLTFDRFCASAETRRDYWKMATESYPVLRDAEPNRAHYAMAAIERAGKLLCLVTQNIDGLHQRAGNSPKKIIEIHGTSLRATCLSCSLEHDREEIHRQIVAGRVEVPACDSCGGVVKPATVSFGQSMPEQETQAAFKAARECDLMIVVGSSLVVYPAADLPREAVASGAALIIVNREPTDKDSSASVVLGGSAGEALSQMVTMASIGED